jgi:copper chaperone CopZ
MLRLIPRRLLFEPTASVERLDVSGRRAVATLRIEGLVCDLCAARAGRSLRGLPGVHAARVDLERSTARVAFDPVRVTLEALCAAVEHAALLRPLRRTLAAIGRLAYDSHRSTQMSTDDRPS